MQIKKHPRNVKSVKLGTTRSSILKKTTTSKPMKTVMSVQMASLLLNNRVNVLNAKLDPMAIYAATLVLRVNIEPLERTARPTASVARLAFMLRREEVEVAKGAR
jgi:hypothetical protein